MKGIPYHTWWNGWSSASQDAVMVTGLDNIQRLGTFIGGQVYLQPIVAIASWNLQVQRLHTSEYYMPSTNILPSCHAHELPTGTWLAADKTRCWTRLSLGLMTQDSSFMFFTQARWWQPLLSKANILVPNSKWTHLIYGYGLILSIFTRMLSSC